MSRHDADAAMFDPDCDFQDSAQAILHSPQASPRVPRDVSHVGGWMLVAAVVIVGLCAGTVLVACNALGAA